MGKCGAPSWGLGLWLEIFGPPLTEQRPHCRRCGLVHLSQEIGVVLGERNGDTHRCIVGR